MIELIMTWGLCCSCESSQRRKIWQSGWLISLVRLSGREMTNLSWGITSKASTRTRHMQSDFSCQLSPAFGLLTNLRQQPVCKKCLLAIFHHTWHKSLYLFICMFKDQLAIFAEIKYGGLESDATTHTYLQSWKSPHSSRICKKKRNSLDIVVRAFTSCKKRQNWSTLPILQIITEIRE